MPIFCDACGHQNRDGAQFCQGCGGKILVTASGGNLQPGTILDKRYEIKRLLKAGGMGAVYEALDRRFENQPVALKEMLSHSTGTAEQQYMIDRFKEEAKILRNLRHLNLPGVIDYFIEAGRYYLVMDYIEGRDLETVLQGYGGSGVPENLVIEWSKQVLDALEYLHNQSPPIIYRDLKPCNIMLRSSDNRIMLVDFGIARTVTPGSDTLKTSIGTPAFAPKELFEGKAGVRTDIYSLGATMHCLLTGIIPSSPFSFNPVRKFNPRVSVALEKIVMKALEMNVEDRYVSVREMKDAILKISSPSQPSLISATEPSPASFTVPSSFSPQPTSPSASMPSRPATVPSVNPPQSHSIPNTQPAIPSPVSGSSPSSLITRSAGGKKSFYIPAVIVTLFLCIGCVLSVSVIFAVKFFPGFFSIPPVFADNTPVSEPLDNTPASVTNSYPEKGDKNVSVDSKIKLFFDGEVKDLSDYIFTFSPSVEGTVSFSKSSMIFEPSNSLKEGTEYEVIVKNKNDDILYSWSFATAAPKKLTEEDLNRAITADVKEPYDYDESKDRIEIHNEDFDSDGIEEVLVVLRVYSVKNDVKEETHMFIFKPDVEEYKLIFNRALPEARFFSTIIPGADFKWENVKIIKASGRIFMGFSGVELFGGSGNTFTLTVYSYDSNTKSYEELYSDGNGAYDFYNQGDNVWISKVWYKYEQDCPHYQMKSTTEYFLWDGSEFVGDHEEGYTQ